MTEAHGAAHTPPGPALTPVFMLSLPRSGSTLLQRIVATHTAIATGPEPTFLLPLLNIGSDAEVAATFDQRFTAMAVEDFLQSTGDARGTFDEMVRAAAGIAYSRASTPGARFFLDKTPKYHMVVDDLLRVFPNSPVIVLWRNPLAVIASLMTTWGRPPGRWNLQHFRLDLFVALPALVEAVRAHPDRFLAIRYEDLVADRAGVATKVFEALGLDVADSDIDEFAAVELVGRIQDPNVGNTGFREVRSDRVDRWIDVLSNPLRKAWCRRYLRWLGSDRLETMGYRLDELLGALDDVETDARFLVRDLVDVPYDSVYRLLELGLLGRKLRDLIRGHRPLLAHK